MTDRRIDLDRARREAKALLRAARAGDPEALVRLRDDREPRLADAQRAVARDHGERSWPCSCVAASNSPQFIPPPARAR